MIRKPRQAKKETSNSSIGRSLAELQPRSANLVTRTSPAARESLHARPATHERLSRTLDGFQRTAADWPGIRLVNSSEAVHFGAEEMLNFTPDSIGGPSS